MPENLAANQVSMSFIATDGVKEEEEALSLIWDGYDLGREMWRQRGGEVEMGLWVCGGGTKMGEWYFRIFLKIRFRESKNYKNWIHLTCCQNKNEIVKNS